MRKYSIILLAAAMGLLAACVKEQPSENKGATLTVRISSEAPAPQPMKTHLGEVSGNKRKVYWSDNDAIRVNGVASEALSGLADNTSSATFSFPSALGAAPYSIFYPADKWTDATHVTLPATQTYKADGFADGFFPMAGYSADGSSIAIHHLCSILKVNILRKAGDGADEHDLVSVTFRGLADEQVSGNFELDYQNATLSGTSSAAADKEVKVVRVVATSTINAASYYIVVPAGTYSSGIAVDIQDQGGDLMTMSKSTSVTFEAGMLYDMSEIPFEPTGSAPANLIITTAEELIQFATDYNSGAISGDDIVVALGNNISFTDQSAAFNATGGIGSGSALFNGLFDGAGYSIDGLQATVPLFARVGKNGTVKNLTMGATSSVSYSDPITATLYMAAIAGYCKGDILDCKNYAPVTVSSTSRDDGKILYLGGVVARQNETGTISGCENHGAVTCTVSAGNGDVYMGGIAGTVERPASANTALITNCSNSGAVKNGLDSGEPAQAHILHMGGVVGWIYSTTSSGKMTVTGLVNTGYVMKTNTASKVDIPVLVAGIVGGIHGAQIASASGQVAIKDSYSKNCTVQNGTFDNALGYGEAAHTGGFVGVARGGTITFSDNCYVSNVAVACRRGYAGGFASWATGTAFDGCNVIASAVQGSLAQLRRGGGLAGHLRAGSVSGCMVTLTKDGTHSLYGAADANNDVLIGGIVGSSQDNVSIEGSKVFVKLMYVGTNKSESHGWVLGSDLDGTATIKDCGLGGTYGNGTAALTLTDGNFADYICGAGTPSITGTNYLWDASDAPAGPKSVEIVIADYAAAHGWTNGGTESPQTIEQDGVTLTASSTGSLNGNYNTQWRFYQARGGGLTVTAPSGKTLISATFTYNSTNTGILIAPDGSTQVPSGTACPLSGNSAFFTIGNTGSATNGQCRFTKIVVEYE